jgi:transcription elongation factor Elf1
MNKAKLKKIVRSTPCVFCNEKVMTIINYVKNGTALVECGKCGQKHAITIKELKDRIRITLETSPNHFKARK